MDSMHHRLVGWVDGCGPLERDLASQDLAQHNKVATEAEERVLEGRGLVLLEHKVADLCVCVCVCVIEMAIS